MPGEIESLRLANIFDSPILRLVYMLKMPRLADLINSTQPAAWLEIGQELHTIVSAAYCCGRYESDTATLLHQSRASEFDYVC